MEQLVRVQKTETDGTATVIRMRESACSGDCHKCSGCGSAQQTLKLQAVNAIGAQAGDMVVISTKTSPVLMCAAVLYLLPLVLFFAGYFLGEAVWGLGAVVGCLAFALGILLAVLYDRLVARKQEPVYTITGYAAGKPAAVRTEGDDEL